MPPKGKKSKTLTASDLFGGSDTFSLEEKRRLLDTIQHYGLNNIKKIQEALPNRKFYEIELFVDKRRKSKRMSYVRNTGDGSTPIEMWESVAEDLMQLSTDYSSVMGEVMMMLGHLEPHAPLPSDNPQPDYGVIYKYLGSLLKGQPPPQQLDSLNAVVVLDILHNLAEKLRLLTVDPQRKIAKHKFSVFHEPAHNRRRDILIPALFKGFQDDPLAPKIEGECQTMKSMIGSTDGEGFSTEAGGDGETPSTSQGHGERIITANPYVSMGSSDEEEGDDDDGDGDEDDEEGEANDDAPMPGTSKDHPDGNQDRQDETTPGPTGDPVSCGMGDIPGGVAVKEEPEDEPPSAKRSKREPTRKSTRISELATRDAKPAYPEAFLFQKETPRRWTGEKGIRMCHIDRKDDPTKGPLFSLNPFCIPVKHLNPLPKVPLHPTWPQPPPPPPRRAPPQAAQTQTNASGSRATSGAPLIAPANEKTVIVEYVVENGDDGESQVETVTMEDVKDDDGIVSIDEGSVDATASADTHTTSELPETGPPGPETGPGEPVSGRSEQVSASAVVVIDEVDQVASGPAESTVISVMSEPSEEKPELDETE